MDLSVIDNCQRFTGQLFRRSRDRNDITHIFFLLKQKNEVSIENLTFDELTKLYVYFFRIVGLLPWEGRDYSYFGTRLLLVYFLFIGFINWSTMVSFCINTSALGVDSICEMILVVGANARYYLLLHRRSEFNKLLTECRSLWDQLPKDGYASVYLYEQKIRKLFHFLMGSCTFVNVLYSITALTSPKLPPLEPNGTERSVLPYKWYIDNPENLWPGYGLTFFIQLLVVQSASILACTSDTAAPLLMMISSGYLRALQDRLHYVSECFQCSTELDDEGDRELIACTKFHQGILELCSKIEGLMRILFLVQVLGTGYNLSLIGLKLAGTDPDKYKFVSLFLLNLGQLFVCQWAPDYLIDESEAVSTAAYFASFNWMKRRFGRLLVIVIARAQRPIQMTAGGIVILSLENFGNMLTSALSFFTVLRSFNL